MNTIEKNAIEISHFRKNSDFKKFMNIIQEGNYVKIGQNIYKKITFLEYLKYKRMASYLKYYEAEFLFLEHTSEISNEYIKNNTISNKTVYLFYIYDSNRYGVMLLKENIKLSV